MNIGDTTRDPYCQSSVKIFHVGSAGKTLTVALVLQGLVSIYALPLLKTTTARWNQPCAGDENEQTTPTFASKHLASPTRTPSDHYKRISNIATEVKEIVDDIMNKYKSDRYKNDAHTKTLEKITLEGLSYNATDLSPSDALLKAYDRLSRAVVFLEESRRGETNHEYEGGFAKNYTQIEEGVLSVLCQISKVMDSNRFKGRELVTRAVMDQKWRHLSDNAMRRDRDYIILSNTGKILHHVRRLLDTLNDQTDPSTP